MIRCRLQQDRTRVERNGVGEHEVDFDVVTPAPIENAAASPLTDEINLGDNAGNVFDVERRLNIFGGAPTDSSADPR
jgi:hypothetical protein